MDRSSKENPAISNQLLANQPGPGEKLFSQALFLQRDAPGSTYVPPQRQAVHRDHRSQDCGESWQALWSLDASTSLLSPEHQSKIKAAVSTGLCYRKRHTLGATTNIKSNTWPCFRLEVGATTTLVSIPESATAGIALNNLENS